MKQLPKIAVGTWSWGTGGYTGGDAVFGNQLNEEQLKVVVDTAMQNGLNLFDTALVYSDGESERILGDLLTPYPREEVLISDKFTPNVFDPAAENPVKAMLEGSLERMHTDYFDIYWIHNSADIEKWTPLLAQTVKETGQIKKIGVSNHSLAEVKRVQEILAEYDLKLSAVQNHFSLLYTNSIEDGLLDYCKENDIQFFSYMILEQGALSGAYDENHLMPASSMRGQRYNPLLTQMAPLFKELNQIANTHQASIAQIVTAWAIHMGTTPILGMTKEKHVLEAAKASQLSLSTEEMTKINEAANQIDLDVRGG